MERVVLGLDVGGANLKAATADKRAVSVPFPLWREPTRLPAVLAELVARFPDATELAVTMTGELCDCFETKRDGVNAILDAVLAASRSHPVRVWGTNGRFMPVGEARLNWSKVAAANWHALATFAGGYVPNGPAVLIDVGSTTTDVIPILDGVPVPEGKTDPERMQSYELVYTGVRRTPVCAVLGLDVAAELFATTLDAYLVLGHVPENPEDSDTADGRPATKKHAHARLSRMLGGDPVMTTETDTTRLAGTVYQTQVKRISHALTIARERTRDVAGGKWSAVWATPVITSGSGEFLAQAVSEPGVFVSERRSLGETLGPDLTTCAPAYAIAVLATERRA